MSTMEKLNPPSRVVRFGTFEFDRVSAELRRQGLQVRIQEQPLKLLEILLERPGDVVTREDLRDRLWAADTFVGFDNSLNNAVNKLRTALGDSAENPRFVQTVGRRGYRFIAPVEVAAGGGPTETEPPAPAPAPPGAGGPRRGRWAAAAAIALVLAGGVGLRLGTRPSEEPAAPPIRSLAVLAFENLSGDPGEEYFADGMTDAIITQLAALRELRVISRHSSMRYRGSPKPLAEIARELRVDAVVEGSVTRSEGRVRVTAQLIHADTDRHLWARSYERELRDVLALQGDVARSIAQEIRLSLSPFERDRLASTLPVNPAAYEAYLRGRHFQARNTARDMDKAIEELERAIALDPDYAPAHAALASCHVSLGSVFMGRSPRQTRPLAAAAAARALRLDPTLAEAQGILAVLSFREWNWTEAEPLFRHALELNPGSAPVHSTFSTYLAIQARWDEALAEARRAQELDPLSLATRMQLGMTLDLARQHDAAVAQLQSVLELDPEYPWAHWFLGIAYLHLARHDDAIASFERSVLGTQRSPSPVAWLAYGHALAGHGPRARELLAEVMRIGRTGYVSPAAVGFIHFALGERDEAFAWLEKARQERSNALPLLRVYAFADPMRSDPRFGRLLTAMGLEPLPAPP